MHCDHCIMRISKSLKQISGVEKVDISLDTKDVRVTHSDQVTESQIVKAINSVGYTVSGH